MAEKLFQENHYDAFDLALEIASLLRPDNGAIFAGLAQSAFSIGEYGRATKLLETAISIDPENAHVLGIIQNQIEALEAQ